MQETNRKVITMADLQPLHDLLDASYPARLRDVAECLYMQLIDDKELQHYERSKLAQLAINQTEYLSQELGGVTFYMVKGTSHKQSQRDKAVWERFNGQNYEDLAREFQISVMRVRQIVEKMRAEFIAQNQRSLALDEPPQK